MGFLGDNMPLTGLGMGTSHEIQAQCNFDSPKLSFKYHEPTTIEITMLIQLA